jgi:hypothetical protein
MLAGGFQSITSGEDFQSMILISYQLDTPTLPGQRNLIIQQGSELTILNIWKGIIEQNS